MPIGNTAKHALVVSSPFLLILGFQSGMSGYGGVWLSLSLMSHSCVGFDSV